MLTLWDYIFEKFGGKILIVYYLYFFASFPQPNVIISVFHVMKTFFKKLKLKTDTLFIVIKNTS